MTTKKLLNKIMATLLCFVIVSVASLVYPVIMNQQSEQAAKVRDVDKGKKIDEEVAVLEENAAVLEENVEGQKIRVLIKNGESEYHERVVVTSAGAFQLNQQEYGAEESVEVTMENGAFQDEVISVTGEGGIGISSISREQGVPVYPGVVHIYRGAMGLFVVNEVDLETYLRYVVPSEMPSGYEAEALKAQAVCARTYGYRYILDKTLEEFHADVDDSIIYQVYNNIAPQETTDRAIEETKGEILTYQGEPITAYFFSTSCGYTSTDEVWNTDEGQAYLKSIYMNEEDVDRSMETEEAFAAFISSNTDVTYEQKEKWYRWRVTLPYAYINEKIAAEYPSLGTLVDMRIQKRGEGGAVEELLVNGSEDALLLSSEYDIRDFLAPGDHTISTNDGESTITSGLLPSAYFTYEAAEDGITFIGGGYGHGVGLSQNGANNLAKNSKTYSEILDFFYQNIQITRLKS